jgi:hypothetical protein
LTSSIAPVPASTRSIVTTTAISATLRRGGAIDIDGVDIAGDDISGIDRGGCTAGGTLAARGARWLLCGGLLDGRIAGPVEGLDGRITEPGGGVGRWTCRSEPGAGVGMYIGGIEPGAGVGIGAEYTPGGTLGG